MSETTKQPDPAKAQKLDDLARQIRDGHDQCLASFRTGVQHARNTGDLLNQAKPLVPTKQWEAWVEENCRFELRMAQNYMRIAKHCKNVEAKLGPVDQFSMTQLLGLIKKVLDEEKKGRASSSEKTGGAAGTTGPVVGVGADPTAPASASDDPDAVPRLPEGGNKLKRHELDALRAEGDLTVEEDEKLARFVAQKAEAIYAAVRRLARKEWADLAGGGKLDLAHLVIVVIDKLKKMLNAEKVFLAPKPKPAGEKPAGEKPAEDKGGESERAEENTHGDSGRDQAPAYRVAEFTNGHAEMAGVGG